MKNGFVFGKYYPFHLGHKSLIDFALSKCDKLYIVVCASTKENINVTIRANWIRDTFIDNSSIQIIELKYNEDELPNTSVSSLEISKKWSSKFITLLPNIDFIVTSEKYGEYVARFMNIKHFYFDINRSKYPISSTLIRNSLYKNWDYLPNPVKLFYQIKVVFLGTECTGKSSLSHRISKKYNSKLVTEVGRELINDSHFFSEELLIKVAKLHAKRINDGINSFKPIVFIDTDVHITQSYAMHKFGKQLKLDQSIYKSNKADIHFYLCTDLPYQQDGTRLNESDRNKLDLQHRKTLSLFNIEIIDIKGNWNERLDKIESILDKLLIDRITKSIL